VRLRLVAAQADKGGVETLEQVRVRVKVRVKVRVRVKG